jgi:acyl-homoserine-lactone acylase
VLARLVLLAALLLAGAAAAGEVEIRRTAYGIPHIRAADHYGLGLGIGHAYAQDNLCLLAEAIVTVRGQRSRYFGPDNDAGGYSNLDSDFFHRFYLRRSPLSQTARDLLDGYAAGYNRLVPAACAFGEAGPIKREDLELLLAAQAIRVGGARLVGPILGQAGGIEVEPAQAGSNALAIGATRSATGGGLLLANPHFPWSGINRFYQMHLTIPGVLDVMGATLPPLPAINIGFNADIAWTHTVSTADRLTLHALQMSADGEGYIVDGQVEPLRTETVKVELPRPDGTMDIRSRVFRSSRFGPLARLPGSDQVYAVGDINRGNARMIDQWLAIGQARDVAGLHAALATYRGVPWANTLASDRTGRVLYADIGAVPAVTEGLAANCAVPAGAATRLHVPVLDGTRAACAVPGLMPLASSPVLIRDDYVLNANDSYWLANAVAPLTGYPAIFGAKTGALRWRTRMLYKRLDELSGRAITAGDLAAMVTDNRNYTAELVLDPLFTVCGEVCAILAAWDRTNRVEARGAAFYREVWRRLVKIDGLWRTPWQADRPVTTPRDLNVDDPRIVAAVRDAAAAFAALGLDPAAPLGQLQWRPTPAGPAPLPGGEESEGVLNQMGFGPLGRAGYGNAELRGSSYVQVVEWQDGRPVARALLTYSQSSDPASPHYADQGAMFAAGTWLHLPFTAVEIAADPALTVTRLVY